MPCLITAPTGSFIEKTTKKTTKEAKTKISRQKLSILVWTHLVTTPKCNRKKTPLHKFTLSILYNRWHFSLMRLMRWHFSLMVTKSTKGNYKAKLKNQSIFFYTKYFLNHYYQQFLIIILYKINKKFLMKPIVRSLDRLSHGNGLKKQKNSKKIKQFAKTQIIEAIKIISYYLNTMCSSFFLKRYWKNN